MFAIVAEAQQRLVDQIAEHQEAANDYVQDGIRLLELSKRPVMENAKKKVTLSKVAFGHIGSGIVFCVPWVMGPRRVPQQRVVAEYPRPYTGPITSVVRLRGAR